ncbi:MAG TPA: hypothetical protein VH934_12380 [Xanthobacteraceae bacterium]|jgi:hypothetical protein
MGSLRWNAVVTVVGAEAAERVGALPRVLHRRYLHDVPDNASYNDPPASVGGSAGGRV